MVCPPTLIAAIHVEARTTIFFLLVSLKCFRSVVFQVPALPVKNKLSWVFSIISSAYWERRSIFMESLDIESVNIIINTNIVYSRLRLIMQWKRFTFLKIQYPSLREGEADVAIHTRHFELWIATLLKALRNDVVLIWSSSPCSEIYKNTSKSLWPRSIWVEQLLVKLS